MITLTPAYGRDYKSKAGVIASFSANKDFIINEFGNRYDGKPVNRGQLIEAGVKKVQFRFSALRKTFLLELNVGGKP